MEAHWEMTRPLQPFGHVTMLSCHFLSLAQPFLAHKSALRVANMPCGDVLARFRSQAAKRSCRNVTSTLVVVCMQGSGHALLLKEIAEMSQAARREGIYSPSLLIHVSEIADVIQNQGHPSVALHGARR